MKKWQAEAIALLMIFGSLGVAFLIFGGGAWLISTSDLPDWFKFWLLR